MSALTGYRNVPRYGGVNDPVLPSIDVPLKDQAKIYVGSAVAIDSSGYGVDPTAVPGLICCGIAHPQQGFATVYDNTTAGNPSHANGNITAKVDQGVFRFLNGTSADAIAQANVGQLCYLIDDQTVGLTDGEGTPRSVAGVIMGLDSNSNVFVSMVFQITAALLAAKSAEGVVGVEQLSGATIVLSPTIETSIIAVSGTMAGTLVAGTRIGQRKRMIAKSAASTPNCVVTVTSLSDSHSTITLAHLWDGALLEWDGSHWNPIEVLASAAIA